MIRYILILLVIQAALAAEVHHIKLRQSPHENYDCLILEENTVRKFKGFETSDENELKIFTKAAISAPTESLLQFQDDSKIIEIFSRNLDILESHVDALCRTKKTVQKKLFVRQQVLEAPEVVKIVDGGDQANRIDVVFMGDGYTLDERDKFFSDIRRLTTDMFEGDTFRSYLPLFNIWAIYIESVDSGIGYNGAKNTPFRLYRSAGQLRGIYTGNAQYAREVCRLTGTYGCDYPSLIGNDDYYGGLGGEFVISTKSERTGTVVLRHEMGHNFVNVGEEYDNGSAYRGVNSAPNLTAVVEKWGHWLSSENVREERVIYRLLEYPWADLSEGEQTFTFTSDGEFYRWHLDVTVSAAGEEDSLEFVLDGEILDWKTRGSDDREFYEWFGDSGFSAGEHLFTVRSKTPSTNVDIPRMICSVRLYEFGNEDEFEMDNDFVSAYPTFDTLRRVTYRPTHAGCLMRRMTHNQFCSVCKEGMWYQFLQRISLIDELTVSQIGNPDRTKRVILNTLKLGQLRNPTNVVEGERLEIRWYRGGQHQVNFDDKFEIDAQTGLWEVSVRLITPEVRHDPTGLLYELENFTVTFPVNGTAYDIPSFNLP